MRIFSLLTAFILFFPNVAASQQATTPASASSTQATALLARSAAALTGTATLSDVTLSGTVRRIAGSDDESGTATLKALASGAGRMDLSLPSGSRNEVADFNVATPAGAWSGPDGVSHAIAYHNLLTEPAWFFPAFAIARRLSNSSYVATYIGHETHEGQAVEHISVSQTASFAQPPSTPSFQHLTQVDFFLDSTTLLPSAIDFNIHPDNDALLDLPIEIRFSDYRATGGSQVAYHIQKFLNNSLTLDLQFQSATFNTGLSSAVFSVQ